MIYKSISIEKSLTIILFIIILFLVIEIYDDYHYNKFINWLIGYEFIKNLETSTRSDYSMIYLKEIIYSIVWIIFILTSIYSIILTKFKYIIFKISLVILILLIIYFPIYNIRHCLYWHYSDFGIYIKTLIISFVS